MKQKPNPSGDANREARPVKDIIEPAKTLANKVSVQAALNELQARGVDWSPVTDQRGELLGAVSKNEMNRKVGGMGHDPKTELVEAHMEKNNPYCFEDQTVAEAEQIMLDANVAEAPVVTREKLVVGTTSLEAIAQDKDREKPTVSTMELDYSFGDIETLWIDGRFPLKEKRVHDHRVKAKLSGKSNSNFPRVLPVGDLLCSERRSPLQHAVTLVLAYAHSITPSGAVQDDNEWWTIPGSTICGQVCIRLTAEAIAQIREVDGDGYNYELALENVELTNRTPTNHECSIQTSAAMDLRPETLERSVDAFFAPSECPVTLQP